MPAPSHPEISVRYSRRLSQWYDRQAINREPFLVYDTGDKRVQRLSRPRLRLIRADVGRPIGCSLALWTPDADLKVRSHHRTSDSPPMYRRIGLILDHPRPSLPNGFKESCEPNSARNSSRIGRSEPAKLEDSTRTATPVAAKYPH